MTAPKLLAPKRVLIPPFWPGPPKLRMVPGIKALRVELDAAAAALDAVMGWELDLRLR